MKKLLVLNFILAFGISILHAQFTSSSFGTRIDITSGTGTSTPQTVAGADLDGDGNQDIVVTNQGNYSLSIFRNISTLGSISFATKIDLTTLANPCFVTLADIDGDFKKEIIIGYNGGTQFSIFRNTTTTIGTITFASRQDITANSVPSMIAAGDLDGDLKADLIAPNFSSGNFSVFRNTSTVGTISFATKVDYTIGSGPSTAAVYDVDGDGKNDVSVANYNTGSISVFKNVSTGTGSTSLSLYVTLTTPALPNFLKGEDVDGDGRKDLVCSNYNGNNISIFRNISATPGYLIFASRIDYTSGSGSSAPQGIAVKDLDGDGKADIAVNNRLNNTVSVFQNTGSPGTISLGTAYIYTTGSSPTDLCIVDLDNDSKGELIGTNNGVSSFYIFRNQIIANAPTTAPSNLNFSGIGNNNMTLSFTKGNGTRRIVLCKASAAVSAAPVSGTLYTASSTFGSGSQIGTGNYVVYNDTGNTFTLTGLTQNTTYYFAIFEYNGNAGFANYLTTAFNYLTGSQVTSNIAFYFSKATGNLNSLSTWGLNTDGTGTAPSSFSNANSYYFVRNNSSPTINGNLTITGGNTALIIGDGVNTFNFNIPAAYSVTTDTLVVKKFSSITISGTLSGISNVFEDTTTAQYLSSSAQNIPTASYWNLITGSSVKTLYNGNVVARNSLTMMSSVNLNNYAMMIGTSTTQLGTLNYVAGTVYGGILWRWFAASTNSGSTGLFPVGTSTAYRPIQINYTNSPTSGGALAASFSSIIPNQNGLPQIDIYTSPIITVNKIGTSGTWTLTPSGLTGGQFTTTMTATNFYGISSTGYADLRMMRRNNSSSAWTLTGTALATTGSGTTPVLSRTGMNAFGEFGVGGDSTTNLLPVKLIILTVHEFDNNAVLNWQTGSEINSDHFEVERSLVIGHWSLIGNADAAVNSTELKNYQFTDHDLSTINHQPSTIYYRLKQVDKDGSVTNSNIVTLELKKPGNSILLFPLPIKNILKAVSQNNEVVNQITIFDLNGKQLISSTSNELDVSWLAQGMYIAKVETDRQVYYQKITK